MHAVNDRYTRPRLLMAYVDSAHAAQCGRYFRRQGWEVRLASCGAEARRLAAEWGPRVLVIDTDLPDESGWLTRAKLALECPQPAVYMLAPQRSDELLKQTHCAGVKGLVARAEGVEALAAMILGEEDRAKAV